MTWSLPNATRTGAAGAGFGLVAGGVPLVVHLGSIELGIMTTVAAAAGGALLGAARARERWRRAEAQAQALRVHALERSLLLRDTHESELGGKLEGQVAAGQYRLVRRMGSGATGVIYEAVRISDGGPVAVKLLRAAAAHEAVASDRLRREAEALGLSWHPNVVEVLDHGHLPDGTSRIS